jgi:hypothetical protein
VAVVNEGTAVSVLSFFKEHFAAIDWVFTAPRAPP